MERAMASRIILTDEDRDRIWALYAGREDLTVDDIAAAFGIHPTTLYTRIREWGWEGRWRLLARNRRSRGEARLTRPRGWGAPAPPLPQPMPALPPGAPDAVPPPAVAPEPGPASPGEAAAALVRQASRQIASLEAALAAGEVEPERAARVLASLARTLAAARSLEPSGGPAADDDDEPPPRSLGELRLELAAHLARHLRNRRAGDGEADPPGA
jgi:hypothetical protein